MELSTEAQVLEALQVRRKKVEALKAGLYPKNMVERAYVVPLSQAESVTVVTEQEAVLERTISNTALRSGTAQIDKNTVFYVAGIYAAVIKDAPPVDGADPQQFSQPPKQRIMASGGAYPNGTGNFRWQVRDTGQDREWQNDVWLPSLLLNSGDENALMASRGLGVLSGGALIEVRVMPLEQNVDQDFRFVFFGVERRLG